MAASGGATGANLTDCPAAHHVTWMIEKLLEGAPETDAESLAQHLVLDPEIAATAAEVMFRSTLGDRAIAHVKGWRETANGRVAISYLTNGGRACELSWRIAPDGRLEDQVVQSSDTAVEITGARTDELSEGARRQLHNVFAAAYTGADPGYLDRELAALQGIGYATDPTGEIIAFTLYGWRELDLPVIGVHGVGLPGLACVTPAARRKGTAGACGQAAGLAAVRGPLHLAVTKLATPASLRWVMRSLPVGRWPTLDDPFALYRDPTPTQLRVLDALARAHGCNGARNAVAIGHGRSIGRPNIEPDVTAEEASLFDGVDRSHGDSLLWVAWLAPPPAAWFDQHSSAR